MENEVKELKWDLDDELELQIADLLLKAGMEQDPAERGKLYDCALKLIDARDKRKNEKKRQFLQYVEIALKALGVFGPLMLYSVLFNRGLEFEQTGSVRSKFFGNLIGKIKPTT